jgi:hypothetical protein
MGMYRIYKSCTEEDSSFSLSLGKEVKLLQIPLRKNNLGPEGKREATSEGTRDTQKEMQPGNIGDSRKKGKMSSS